MLKDVLAILASTPQKLKQELSSMSLKQMQTRPAANKWSVQEVLAHLDDVEEIGMRARVAAMLEAQNPLLPSFDQEKRVEEMKYHRKHPLKSLASLARQREANVKWLRTLKPAQLKRRGTHQKVGEIAVEEFGDGMGVPRPRAPQADSRDQTLCAFSANRKHAGVL